MAKFMGGSRRLNGVTTTQYLWHENSRFVTVRSLAADVHLTLPNALGRPLGGPYYYLHNELGIGGHNVELVHIDDSFIIDLRPKQFVIVNLLDNTTANGIWSVEAGTIPPPDPGPFYYADSTDVTTGADTTTIFADNQDPSLN